MRVGFDTKAVLSGHQRAGMYFLELLPELLNKAQQDDELVVFATEGIDGTTLRWLLRDDKLRRLTAPFGGQRTSELWRSLAFPPVERLISHRASGIGPLDVCHSIYSPLMPSSARLKVLTLPHLEPASNGRVSSALRRSLKSADTVLVTSVRLKDEIQRRVASTPRSAKREQAAAEAEAKVRVVAPGVHERFRSAPKPTEVEALCETYPFLDEPYLLAMGGSAEPDDSVPFLAETCVRALGMDPSLPPLAVVAQPEHSERIIHLLSDWGLEGHARVIEDVETEALPALYRGAEQVLYPAMDFAYGLPVAESAANAIPSVVGPGCGAYESLGEAATVPEHMTPESWAHTIVALHKDEGRRRALGRLAQERVSGLTWERTAQEHWRIYRG